MITTERLHISPLQLSDADFIYQLLNTEGWKTFIGDKNINTKEDAENYIQKILDNPNYHYNVFHLTETMQP